MHHPSIFMQILQGLGNLDYDMATQVFAEVCQSDDLVEELASRAKLKNDIVVLSGFGEVDEFDDVGVIDLPHDLHLFQDVRSLHKQSPTSA